MVRIFNGILISHKKEGNNTICRNMDRSRDCHSEWSTSKGEKWNHITLLTYEIKKIGTDELICKAEIKRHRCREETYEYQGGQEGLNGLGGWD